jgi:hypothetical protein
MIDKLRARVNSHFDSSRTNAASQHFGATEVKELKTAAKAMVGKRPAEREPILEELRAKYPDQNFYAQTHSGLLGFSERLWASRNCVDTPTTRGQDRIDIEISEEPMVVKFKHKDIGLP